MPEALVPGDRIPITVVGGFLGAGKTTLLNGILAGLHGFRVAVLVNDFGSVNVDAELIASHCGEIIALTNGCICCSMGDSLTEALIRVMTQAPPPDWIVIEASGIADPWPIAQVGLADPGLTLDGIIVVADAVAILEQGSEPRLMDTLARQLEGADLIIVNKCDLASAEDLAQTRGWIERTAPGLPIFETTHAVVPLELATGIVAERMPARHGQPTHAYQDHSARFESLVLSSDGVFSAARLRDLLAQMPLGVLRAKGIVRTDEYGATDLQFSGRRGSLRALGRSAPGRSRVVAIGLRRELPVEALHAAWRAAQSPLPCSGRSVDSATQVLQVRAEP